MGKDRGTLRARASYMSTKRRTESKLQPRTRNGAVVWQLPSRSSDPRGLRYEYDITAATQSSGMITGLQKHEGIYLA
eukprot:4661750-Prymnesium_polylepis.3